MELEEYLKRYSKDECMQLNRLVKKDENGSLKNAVVALLRNNHRVTEKSIKQYEKNALPQLDAQFVRLMEETREVTELVEKSKSMRSATEKNTTKHFSFKG